VKKFNRFATMFSALILDKKLIPYFGNQFLDEIGGEDVQKFIQLCVERAYAPHSVHHYHTVLSAVLQKAVAWKHIDANPAHGAKLPKLKPVREQHVLTYTQAQSLLGALCLRVRTAVALALSTGARRGELFAVRWKHVDSESRTLSIEQSVYDGVIDSPKTENSVRDIPLHPSIVQLLLEWKSSPNIQNQNTSSLPSTMETCQAIRIGCFAVTSPRRVVKLEYLVPPG
jgi:integrase